MRTLLTTSRRVYQNVENVLAFTLLSLITLFPVLEVLARGFFHTGVYSSGDYVAHLVVWITFAGGMITSREGKHLALTAGVAHIKQPLAGWIENVTSCMAVAVGTVLTWNAISYVREGFDSSQTVGVIPIRLAVLVIPVGLGVITLRFITHAPKGWGPKIVAASGIGVAALLGMVVGNSSQIWTTPCILALVAGAFAGMPVFAVLGGCAALLLHNSGSTVAVIPNEAYTMLTGPVIPTIPLFTLAGFILSESKSGERLVRLFKALFGRLPGGLAIMATLVCAFFTTFTGASGVTILALGGLLSFVLVQSRYTKSFSTGLLTASGSIGLLFPPSLPVILYGVVAHINIKQLYVGGILPGLLMVGILAVMGLVHGTRKEVERPPRVSMGELFSALLHALGEVAFPAIVVVLFFGGITTLVETAAIAVVYALILEVAIHRDLRLRDLGRVFLKSTPIVSGVLVILAMACGLSYYIVDAGIPTLLADWCREHVHSTFVFLLALNAALLVVGCFMDIFSATMIVVPLIAPLAAIYGINPVHLGIIFLANLELGYLTPPVGMNLFLAAYRFEEPLTRIYRHVIPFLLALIVAVLLITYVPVMTTGLLGVVKF